jgi:hypothetical protein
LRIQSLPGRVGERAAVYGTENGVNNINDVAFTGGSSAA